MKSGEIAYGFQGSLYAQVINSPTNYGRLYVGTVCNVTNCGTEATGTVATVGIVNGIANFHNLFFDVAGEGYQLKYIGLAQDNNPFGRTLSGKFSVSRGQPYKLTLNRFLGNAFGGEPFRSYPIVTITDKGGNIITDIDTGEVIANLTTSPTGKEYLRSLTSVKTTFSGGYARFQGLFINEAGYPYRIKFSTSISVSHMLSILHKHLLSILIVCYRAFLRLHPIRSLSEWEMRLD